MQTARHLIPDIAPIFCTSYSIFSVWLVEIDRFLKEAGIQLASLVNSNFLIIQNLNIFTIWRN